MEIQMIFKIVYDPSKDGSLSEFRRKKYQPFRDHVERLQVTGALPRGPVKYAVERKQVPPPVGPGPLATIARPSFGPMLAHQAGTKLDVERIAI